MSFGGLVVEVGPRVAEGGRRGKPISDRKISIWRSGAALTSSRGRALQVLRQQDLGDPVPTNRCRDVVPYFKVRGTVRSKLVALSHPFAPAESTWISNRDAWSGPRVHSITDDLEPGRLSRPVDSAEIAFFLVQPFFLAPEKAPCHSDPGRRSLLVRFEPKAFEKAITRQVG